MNDVMPRELSTSLLALLLTSGIASAATENIQVTANIWSPVYATWNPAADCDAEGATTAAGVTCTLLRSQNIATNEFEPTGNPMPYTDGLVWEPSGHQQVTIWSRNERGPDSLCAELFADATGSINAQVTCELWDATRNANPALELRIEGVNDLDFTVSIDQQKRIQWISSYVPYQRGSGSLNLGSHYMGWDGSTNKTFGAGSAFGSHWAAAGPIIGMVRFTYESLDSMGIPNFPSSWWIDVPNATYAAYVLWGQVHFRHVHATEGDGGVIDPGTRRGNLEAAPHEYGHIVYNNLHSNRRHYNGEITGFPRSHFECVPFDFNLGYYEGFANAVYDIVWREHDSDLANGLGPAVRCNDPLVDEGSMVEANIGDFFYSLVYGDDEATAARPAGANGTFIVPATTVRPAYWLFPHSLLSDGVAAGGHDSHNLHDFWDQYLRNECARLVDDGTGAMIPSVCATQEFICAMEDRGILSPYDMQQFGWECVANGPLGSAGAACDGENTDCRSGRCDAGDFSTGTNQCIPNDGEGVVNDFCTHSNHCGDGLGCRIPNGTIGGTCVNEPGIGGDCSNGLVCASGRHCDSNARCVPRQNTGTLGQYCSNQNQCRSSLNCAMPTGQNFGECTARPGLGADCSNGQVCASRRHCDSSNRCVPPQNTGRLGQYCSNHNQCRSSLNCLIPPGQNFGECAARPGIGDDCSNGQVCADGRHCDGNARCVPQQNTGGVGQYCSNQNQCRNALNCAMLAGQNFGACAERPGIGGDCSNGLACASGRHCDSTNRCVPRQGEGNLGDYCSNQNQCRSTLNCDILSAQLFGQCAARPGIGGDCSNGKRCAGGRNCDGNNRCIPNRNTGAPGDYCSNNVQCLPGHQCVIPQTRNWGQCN